MQFAKLVLSDLEAGWSARAVGGLTQERTLQQKGACTVVLRHVEAAGKLIARACPTRGSFLLPLKQVCSYLRIRQPVMI
jgi:hypothetical protein